MSLNAISANLTSTKLILPVAVFGMMLGLAGCSNSSTTEESVEAETSAAATEQPAATDGATSEGGQTITIYSSRNEQLIKPLLDRYTEQTGVKIDIDDEGSVSICGTEKTAMEKAAKIIHTIVTDFEAGQVFEGKVISIKEFGAFLEFAPGKEGLVHISKIAKERVNKVEDVLSLGDVVKAVCLGKDKMGRFSFSIRDVAE